MNLVKNRSRIKVGLALAVAFLVQSGCGVKGDPLPPLKPADLGRGRPTYKRATQKVKLDEKAGDTVKPLPGGGEVLGEDER